MTSLVCANCSSESDFLLTTKEGLSVPAIGKLLIDSLKTAVTVACNYCGHKWEQLPAGGMG